MEITIGSLLFLSGIALLILWVILTVVYIITGGIGKSRLNSYLKEKY